ncbi:MAG: class I SAM-dependent methyltransferase [Bacillota bacterium]|nr:class I SAM-dependent methyltransferase [Bacillota bacterium]
MSEEVFINMEREVFKGNVLDVGFENYGVIYSLCKQGEDEIAIEYISGKGETQSIKEKVYDSCILLFSLNYVWLKMNKRSLIKFICRFIKEDGIIYLWDIDKGYGKIFNKKIKIVLPDKKVKIIEIKEMNILKDSSKNTVVNILRQYFDIIDVKSSDNVYFIKGRRKGRESSEDKLNWH